MPTEVTSTNKSTIVVEVKQNKISTTVAKNSTTSDVLPLLVAGGDKHYTHNQIAALDTWVISHNLKKFPSVSIVDSGGSVVIGDVEYVNENVLSVKFSGAFSGMAYLN